MCTKHSIMQHTSKATHVQENCAATFFKGLGHKASGSRDLIALENNILIQWHTIKTSYNVYSPYRSTL